MPSEVKQFEDLIAFQRSRALVRAVYGICDRGSLARDLPFRDQMRRAAVSTAINLAEGFDRGRRTEFHQAISISKGSCAEVRALIHIAHDVGHITDEEYDYLLELAIDTSMLIAGLRTAVAKQRDEQKGSLRPTDRS